MGSVQCLSQMTQQVDKAFNIGQRWDSARAFAVSRPKTALFLLAVFIMFSIPLSLFIIIIGSSLFVGLAMLLWVQGAVLTTATAVLLPTLGCCALIAAGLTIVIYSSRYVVGLLRSAWRFVSDVIIPYVMTTVWGLGNMWDKRSVKEFQHED